VEPGLALAISLRDGGNILDLGTQVQERMEIVRALPHGHVLAALGTARRIGMERLLPRGTERRRQLALALIVARLLAPSAKLATAHTTSR